MKRPRLDESVSLCICLLTVACNREIKHLLHFFIGYSLWGEKKDFRSGSASKFNSRVGLGQTISQGSGFSLNPVQTSS